MFALIPMPLAYAQEYFAFYTAISQACDEKALARQLVKAAASLSDCELVQFFHLDPASGGLRLAAQSSDSAPIQQDLDYSDQQLLQFSLRQSRPVSIAGNDQSVYDTRFLPVAESPWQSLRCEPLTGRDGSSTGLLLYATTRARSLDIYGPSLAGLGTFAVSQLQLLRRLDPQGIRATSSSAGCRPDPDFGLIGRSAAMAHVRKLMSKVLHTSHTVLLTGATGTGKEVVARALHEYGPRRSNAFVVQNCAALPEALLESELFGYRKGAFTGADRDRAGLFETADGGTLLLDEIGDMPLSLQAKLLRVLQEGEVRPLGSNVTRKVNVRIIAATHRDLPGMIDDGRFRADLYYRLGQFPISLPTLRQRDNDVMELARRFASDACAALKRSPLPLSEAALDALSSHGFPGNVRELKCMVERAVLMCEAEQVQPEDFDVPGQAPLCADGFNLREQTQVFERDLMLRCLRTVGGNRSLAARKLGVSRRTLLYRLARLQITAACAPMTRKSTIPSRNQP